MHIVYIYIYIYQKQTKQTTAWAKVFKKYGCPYHWFSLSLSPYVCMHVYVYTHYIYIYIYTYTCNCLGQGLQEVRVPLLQPGRGPARSAAALLPPAAADM